MKTVHFYAQGDMDRGRVAAVLRVAGVEVRRELLTLDEARDLHARLGVAIERAAQIDAASRPVRAL